MENDYGNSGTLAKERFTTLDKVICAYIFVEIFLMNSALLNHFFGRALSYVPPLLFVATVSYIVFRRGNFGIKWYVAGIIWLVALCAIVSSLRFASFLPLSWVNAIIFSIALLTFCRKKHLDVIARVGTPLFIILLIGALIGFSYAISGGQPIFKFPNPDTRTNFLFLTTFTNVYMAEIMPGMTNIIRPSGIYDEPGTFSFFLCVLTMFRVLTGKNDFLTYLMLLAGNITFSVAHAIFFVFYNAYMIAKYYYKGIILVYAVVFAVAASLLLYHYYDVFEVMLFARMQGEEVTDNNRTVQVEDGVRLLKNAQEPTDAYIFGFGGIGGQISIDSERTTNSPIGPLVHYGLIISWIYYISMLALFLCGGICRKYRFLFWAIALVYAQRPGFMLPGTATAFYIVTAASISMAYCEVKKVMAKCKGGHVAVCER